VLWLLRLRHSNRSPIFPRFIVGFLLRTDPTSIPPEVGRFPFPAATQTWNYFRSIPTCRVGVPTYDTFASPRYAWHDWHRAVKRCLLTVGICGWFQYLKWIFFCVDDEHADSLSKCRGHRCLCLHATAHNYQTAKLRDVTRKFLWSVCLPHVVWKAASLDISHWIDLRHFPDNNWSLRRCAVSTVVQKQCKNSFRLQLLISEHLGPPVYALLFQYWELNTSLVWCCSGVCNSLPRIPPHPSLWCCSLPSSSTICQPEPSITVPRCRNRTYGCRAFHYASQTVWNSLPNELIEMRTASTVLNGSWKQYSFCQLLLHIRGYFKTRCAI